MVGVVSNIITVKDGENTIDVQKPLDKPWYMYQHLRRLYGWLVIVLLVQATNGLDGSIMNGMQTLPYWQDYFGHPTGNNLGIFNGTQGISGAFAALWLWWVDEHWHWGAYNIDNFGRFIPWTICSGVFSEHGTKAAGLASIACIFIFSGFYASTWNGILTGYTVELMSYDIRSKLICTQNLLVQAAITGINYLNPVALQNIRWKYYIIIDVIIALNIACVYSTYPESRGITLEEISVIFHSKRAAKNDIQKNQEGDETSLDFANDGKGEVVVERHEHVQGKV